jgi:hypothetical protein
MGVFLPTRRRGPQQYDVSAAALASVVNKAATLSFALAEVLIVALGRVSSVVPRWSAARDVNKCSLLHVILAPLEHLILKPACARKS